jgi:hypothetical protein
MSAQPPQAAQKRTLLDFAFVHKRTHAPQQTSGRAFPAVSFVYLSVECPFNKFYGINCRPKLGAKLLDRFFHRRRQVSPPVNNLTHRFFDGSHHFLYRNFTVGSRHSAVASSPVPMSLAEVLCLLRANKSGRRGSAGALDFCCSPGSGKKAAIVWGLKLCQLLTRALQQRCAHVGVAVGPRVSSRAPRIEPVRTSPWSIW